MIESNTSLGSPGAIEFNQDKEFIKAILKQKNNLPTLDNSLKVSKLINLIYRV